MNAALLRGERESRTLAEITALDQAQLARHVKGDAINERGKMQ